MNKNLSINKICFHASFWPALAISVLSMALSLLLFKHHTTTIYEREVTRHELISQLFAKAAASDIIIDNKHALYITIKEFKDKYNLENIRLEKANHTIDVGLFNFIKSQTVKSAWVIPGITPNHYMYFESNINKNMIAMPFFTILGIICLFIFSSILMYQRIKQKLHQQIVKPITQTLNCNGENLEWFDKNSAASEIAMLYQRTNEFIKTLHNQRDLIEEGKVKQAKYDVALQVAHDIRSPVLALDTISKMFCNLNDDARSMIQNVTKRINQIANDILIDYYPNVPQSNQPVATIVQNIVKEKKASYIKNIKFYVDFDNTSSTCITKMPENQLNRVLSNIINNAIESIITDGSIAIVTRVDQDQVYISIIDSGCGISKENLSKIFELGISINKNSTGLGLGFIDKIVKEASGELKVNSEEGMGTTITLILPLQ